MHRGLRISLTSLLCVLGLCGCVERWLQVRTDPPGARLFVNGQDVGTTPSKIPFDHYGTYEILVRVDAETKEEAYESVARLVELDAPWYQWFPLDFVVETLWPFRVTDTREVEINLPRLNPEERYRPFRETLDDVNSTPPEQLGRQKPKPSAESASPPESP